MGRDLMDLVKTLNKESEGVGVEFDKWLIEDPDATYNDWTKSR